MVVTIEYDHHFSRQMSSEELETVMDVDVLLSITSQLIVTPS
jgi:hypothetical protein